MNTIGVDMKLIIAGSRDIQTDYENIVEILEQYAPETVTEVVSGCARGMDTFGEYWAKDNDYPITRMPADWKQFGKAAGPIRNKQMAKYADMAIVVHNGTNGSINMVEQMRKLGKPVKEIILCKS